MCLSLKNPNLHVHCSDSVFHYLCSCQAAALTLLLQEDEDSDEGQHPLLKKKEIKGKQKSLFAVCDK